MISPTMVLCNLDSRHFIAVIRKRLRGRASTKRGRSLPSSPHGDVDDATSYGDIKIAERVTSSLWTVV
jgi:hypothetical protein